MTQAEETLNTYVILLNADLDLYPKDNTFPFQFVICQHSYLNTCFQQIMMTDSWVLVNSVSPEYMHRTIKWGFNTSLFLIQTEMDKGTVNKILFIFLFFLLKKE